MSASKYKDILLFGLLALVGYTLFLGEVPLFDWDEINFAESAREMIVSQNYFQVQINFEPFWEKPPLFFWLQTLSMSIFGINEFAARLPNALIGVVTISYLYYIGYQWKGKIFANILAGLYLGSFLPSIYFKSGIIDPTFNFFIFVGLYHLIKYEFVRINTPELENSDKRPLLVGLFFGLATLTKGPASVLIGGLTYLIYKIIFNRNFPFKGIGKMILSFSIIVFGWYGIETLIHGSWFVQKFFEYQIRLFTQEDAGHGQPIYYHLLVFTFGCFPISIFAFRGMFQRYEDKEEQLMRGFMTVWFWVIMVLFSIAKTKIIHYSSLLYFPGAFLAGLFLLRKIKKEEKVTWDVYFLFILGMLMWGILPSLINVIQSNFDYIIQHLPENRDKPFIKGILSMQVNWSGYEWLIGAIFMLGLCFNVSFLYRKRYLNFINVQIFLTLFLINAEYLWVLPKIARYTQGSNVDFFQGLQNKDVYCLTAKYKSYIPYFYGRTKPFENPKAYDNNWLYEGDIDKDVYISVKNIAINDEFREKFKNFTKLYESGGFVYFVRKKEAK